MGSEESAGRPSRWAGVLDAESVRSYREQGVPLAFDPVQIGWVLLDSEDADISPESRSGSSTSGRRMPALETEEAGVSFRPWTTADVADHRALLDDAAVWEHLPETYPVPFTDQTSNDLIALANADLDHEVVAVEVDGSLVGQCLITFHSAPSSPRDAEVAYWLGRAHWGRGLMSRVLPTFVDRCFRRHNVDTLTAWIHPDNAGSIRVAERSGFRRDAASNESLLAASQDREGFGRWVIRRLQPPDKADSE